MPGIFCALTATEVLTLCVCTFNLCSSHHDYFAALCRPVIRGSKPVENPTRCAPCWCDSQEDDQAAVQERRKKEAHIANLNVDPMLSGNIVHFLDKNKNIGKEAEIVIRGPK